MVALFTWPSESMSAQRKSTSVSRAAMSAFPLGDPQPLAVHCSQVRRVPQRLGHRGSRVGPGQQNGGAGDQVPILGEAVGQPTLHLGPSRGSGGSSWSPSTASARDCWIRERWAESSAVLMADATSGYDALEGGDKLRQPGAEVGQLPQLCGIVRPGRTSPPPG